jgi:hypothetical protein
MGCTSRVAMLEGGWNWHEGSWKCLTDAVR